MTDDVQSSRRGFRAMRLALLVIVWTYPAQGQNTPRTPAELINYLTFRDGKRRRPTGATSCGQQNGQAQEDRWAAASLVSLGRSAVPDLERALPSSTERNTGVALKVNTPWLLYAYAKILGAAAYPRLRQMIGRAELDSLQDALDSSIALSLGLTSYIDGSRIPVRVPFVPCDRALEPRDALDQFILAWERNDPQLLEEALGTNGARASRSFLKGTTWDEMRAWLWRGRSGYGAAVGYRFQIPGIWSKPEEMLDPELARQRLRQDVSHIPSSIEIETAFTNEAGDDCGRFLVVFSRSADISIGSLSYKVDNNDVRDLLQVIASCAAPKSAHQ